MVLITCPIALALGHLFQCGLLYGMSGWRKFAVGSFVQEYDAHTCDHYQDYQVANS
jgi:hypothetical protein